MSIAAWCLGSVGHSGDGNGGGSGNGSDDGSDDGDNGSNGDSNTRGCVSEVGRGDNRVWWQQSGV